MNVRLVGQPAAPTPVAAGRALPWLERAVESVVGNQLGAGVYRRWVESLALAGDELVLEIGSGAGACARHIAAALPQGRLTCLEIDPRWLAIARRRLARSGSRVEFVLGDAAQWSRTCEFDAVIAHFVLHDIPTEQRHIVLQRAAESLRPGGVLHLREPTTHGMSAEELLGQLRDAGFEPVGNQIHAAVPLMGDTLSGAWRR